MVDDEDYDHLMQWKWSLSESKGVCYAVSRVKGKMHRVILNLVDPKKCGDHIDRDGLNNQRFNLRIATQQENCKNRTSRKNSSSRFLGVCAEVYYRKGITLCQYWLPTIFINGKQKKLGRKPYTPCGEILAAVSYDIAAEKYHGNFANLNFK